MLFLCIPAVMLLFFCVSSVAGETPSNALYRPVSEYSSAVILITDADDPPETLIELGGMLESQGCRLFLEPWTTGADRPIASRRGRGGPTPEEQLLARVDSLAGIDPDAPWALGGSGRGSSIALLAASRARRPPACLFVLSPESREEDPAPASLLSDLDAPLLIVATRSAPGAAETHLELYIGARPRSELWILSGEGKGAALLLSRAHLMVDLSDWVCGKLSAAALDQDGGSRVAPDSSEKGLR